ncbi:hypothetical protein [uncultured Dokdonia sp.]|uniref:hypothetical protein n=2 Tax=uncultured Dokdonia sp. TaxID=575653 RepID=UPI00261FA254|nr:hypothetical protein [uncultured Dokdonia sp.]
MYRDADIHSEKMTKLLIASVYEYLDLFGSQNTITTASAIDAMIYHYKDISMVNFYVAQFNQELFVVQFDDLYINIYENELSFKRSFKFSDVTDEVIEIRFKLHIIEENSIGNLIHYACLSKSDLLKDEDSHDRKISEIKANTWYQRNKHLQLIYSDVHIDYNV